jgi:uncharacterized protein with PQ loop repeat
MKNKLCLIGAILTSIVFISLVLEVTGEYYNNAYPIKLKQIIYLIGWLGLSIALFHQHFKNKV